MKLVIAIIQPTKLKAVCEALEKIEVTRLTVSDAQGFGRQRGRTEMYRGHEYTTTLLRKVVLEIVVNDDFLERTISTIIHVARTGPEGTIGDGKIFVLPAFEAIQSAMAAAGREPCKQSPLALWERVRVRAVNEVPSPSGRGLRGGPFVSRLTPPWLDPWPFGRRVFHNLRRAGCVFLELGKAKFLFAGIGVEIDLVGFPASTSRRSR